MAPKTKINLKDRIEDGELDLSLSDLQEVPVRDIATVKKVTSLDLSNNRLTSLGKNFVTLTNIVKLDLSKNLLSELPEDFGEMKQLKHLDLYSNKLTHLPLSFHQLKALRWLDLKNNPLIPALSKVAGPCLDAQQCSQCARSVVTFFSHMNEQVEEERQRREQTRLAELEAEAAQQKQQKKKEKKKVSKAKKPKVKNEKAPEVGNFVEGTQDYSCVGLKNNSVKEKKHASKSRKSYLLTIKFMSLMLLFTFITAFVFTSLKIKPAVELKKGVETLWGGALEKVPQEYRPWAQQLGKQVGVLHVITGNVLENLGNFVAEIQRNESVNAAVNAIWDLIKIGIGELRKLLSLVGDQAVFLTNEIKKKLI